MSKIDAAQKTAKNADQVELRAYRMLNAPIDEGLVDETISGESEESVMTYDDPGADSEEWLKLDDYNESEQGKITDELQKRACLLGNLYPFNLQHFSLQYNPSKSANKLYETLLLTSLATRRQGKDWLNLVDSFEQISTWAINKYFQCSEYWWTGANTTISLQDFINIIHNKTGELEWNPDSNLSGSVSNVKDAGLDFINYRNLIDYRVGGLFFFGQSACGDDWFAKTAHDLKENRYRHFFRPPYANPVRVFTIPYLITRNHEKMITAASNLSGLVFDRARLTTVLSGMQSDRKVKQEIQKIYRLADKKCN